MMNRHHFTRNFNTSRYHYAVVLFHSERPADPYGIQTVYSDESICDPDEMRSFINKYDKVISDTTRIVKINRSDYHAKPGIWETVYSALHYFGQIPNAVS